MVAAMPAGHWLAPAERTLLAWPIGGGKPSSCIGGRSDWPYDAIIAACQRAGLRAIGQEAPRMLSTLSRRGGPWGDVVPARCSGQRARHRHRPD